MLFAEMGIGEIAVALLTGGGGLALASMVRDFIKGRRESTDAQEVKDKVRRKDAVEEWETMFTESKAKIAALETEAGESRMRERNCESRCSRLEARVEYYGNLLRDQGISVKPWSADTGSSLHPPLKEGV